MKAVTRVRAEPTSLEVIRTKENSSIFKTVNSNFTKHENKLTILFANADILTNKLNELKLLVSTDRLDIIAITETNPKQSACRVNDLLFNINGYNHFRSMTETERGVII